jgi:hypothetical protein
MSSSFCWMAYSASSDQITSSSIRRPKPCSQHGRSRVAVDDMVLRCSICGLWATQAAGLPGLTRGRSVNDPRIDPTLPGRGDRCRHLPGADQPVGSMIHCPGLPGNFVLWVFLTRQPLPEGFFCVWRLLPVGPDHCRLRRNCRTTDVIANCQSRHSLRGKGALDTARLPWAQPKLRLVQAVAALGWSVSCDTGPSTVAVAETRHPYKINSSWMRLITYKQVFKCVVVTIAEYTKAVNEHSILSEELTIQRNTSK